MFPPGCALALDDSLESLLPAGSAALAELAAQLPRLQVMRAEYDTGLAAGRNRLLESVETPYVLLLDDDCVAPPQLANGMQDAREAQPAQAPPHAAEAAAVLDAPEAAPKKTEPAFVEV